MFTKHPFSPRPAPVGFSTQESNLVAFPPVILSCPPRPLEGHRGRGLRVSGAHGSSCPAEEGNSRGNSVTVLRRDPDSEATHTRSLSRATRCRLSVTRMSTPWVRRETPASPGPSQNC